MFDWRVYWSVLAALVTFSLVTTLVALVGAALFSYNLQSRMAAVMRHGQTVIAQSQQAERERVARDRVVRALSGSQRCVGGTVVDVSGSTYVQHLQSGRPVACHGRLASDPIR